MGIAVISAFFNVFLQNRSYYYIFFVIEEAILILLFPLIFVYIFLIIRQKTKKKESVLKEKDVELLQKDVELLKKDIEIEKLRQQKAEVTEEDIMVSKEKHFCLVHKGPIQGYSFICPDCGAFYCMKCVEAIIVIDNACWSCEHALDPQRAPQEKVEQETDVKVVSQPDPHKISFNFCKFCGFKLEQRTDICPSCGRQLNLQQ